jgi:uncharacterized membrane protein
MLKEVLLSGILFVMIDSIYLTSISKYFNNQMKLIQGSPLVMNFAGAVLSYIFLIFGLYYFILREKKSIKDAFLFGLVIYMVYEATNKAIIKNWKWTTVLIDGVWGGILYALTTYATYQLQHYLV